MNGWSISNLLQGHTLMLWLFYAGLILFLGLIHFSFRGSVQV